jgi:cell division protein FtsB
MTMTVPLRSTVPPTAPLSAANHSADIDELKAQVASLNKEVAALKAELASIWEKAKSFGVRR